MFTMVPEMIYVIEELFYINNIKFILPCLTYNAGESCDL